MPPPPKQTIAKTVKVMSDRTHLETNNYKVKSHFGTLEVEKRGKQVNGPIHPPEAELVILGKVSFSGSTILNAETLA